MKLIETMCVLGLASAIAVPTMLTFKDTQGVVAAQAHTSLAYIQQAKRQAPELQVVLPDQASDRAAQATTRPVEVEPAVRAYSSRKFR